MKLRDRQKVSLDQLAVLTRRDFCKAAGAGLVALGLPGCFDFVNLTRGSEGGPADLSAAWDLATRPDLATSPDMASSPDMADAPDMATSPDLAQAGDMAQSGDLAHGPDMMPPSDLSVPPDLSTPPDLYRPPDLTPPPDLAFSCPLNAFNTGSFGANFAINTATYFQVPNAFVCRDGGGLFALTAVCTHSGCTVNTQGVNGFLCPCHGSRFSFTGAVTLGPALSPLVHFALCLVNGRIGVDTRSIVGAGVRYNL